MQLSSLQVATTADEKVSKHFNGSMMQLATYQIDNIRGLQWILTIQSKAERTIKNFSYLLVLFLYLFSICREWPCSIDLAILEDFFMQR